MEYGWQRLRIEFKSGVSALYTDDMVLIVEGKFHTVATGTTLFVYRPTRTTTADSLWASDSPWASWPLEDIYEYRVSRCKAPKELIDD